MSHSPNLCCISRRRSTYVTRSPSCVPINDMPDLYGIRMPSNLPSALSKRCVSSAALLTNLTSLLGGTDIPHRAWRSSIVFSSPITSYLSCGCENFANISLSPSLTDAFGCAPPSAVVPTSSRAFSSSCVSAFSTTLCAACKSSYKSTVGGMDVFSPSHCPSLLKRSAPCLVMSETPRR